MSKLKHINYLEKQYPKGLDLVYMDYSNNLDNSSDVLEELLRTGCSDEILEWFIDTKWESIDEVISQYEDELSERERQEMIDWLYDHDTCDVEKELLKNTEDKLFFIETDIIMQIFNDYDNESRKQQAKLLKPFVKNETQKKELEYIQLEQFYQAPLSFYFYLSPRDLFDELHKNESKYIIIRHCYIANVDRMNGSNNICNNAVFDIRIEKAKFLKSFGVDDNKNNGYGWGRIANQTNYTEAVVFATDCRQKECIEVNPYFSEEREREQILQENWDKTGRCRKGDFDTNFNRHSGEKVYENVPMNCGTRCSNCGTFWID